MSSQPRTPADGDWTCSDFKCGNVNFARRSSCNRCGKEKTPSFESKSKQGIEIGKAAAEKSHGLFSADDWHCTKCGNVNWARRQTCNMCNAPRVSELEERTGYGGGFNEREGVEYVRHEESDDEYDAFGIKKKKYRGTDQVVKPIIQAKKPEQSESEEEDDEDEGGDLSKYDLWDDDDEEENKEDGPVKNGADGLNKKNSPSRSRSSSSRSNSSRSRSNSRSSYSSRSSSESPPRKNRERSRSGQESLAKRRYSSSSSRSRSPSRERKYSRK